MMKLRKKHVILFLIILTMGSSIWLDAVFIKSNSKLFAEELKEAGEISDVIIIFNSGGFGTVSLENAYDIKPVIENTKKTIEDMNYHVSVIPYHRTKESLIGRVGYLKEMFFSFPKESEDLASRIKEFLKENPDDKIIMAGLSNGAAFVGATMDDLKDVKSNVSAIQLGTPFWSGRINNENILFLDNNGKDILTVGKKAEIVYCLIKAPFKWVYSRILDKRISFAEAMEAPGHHYYWDNVGGEIKSFVEKELSSN
jgi:hypothetical protein